MCLCYFSITRRCRLFGTVSPSSICYQEVFFVLYLKAICRLWNSLPQVKGIPYISTYSYILYAVLLAPHIATRHVNSQDLDWDIDVLNRRQSWTKYPEPTRAPTKLFQQISVSVQISPTEVGPGPIFSYCRRSSCSGAVVNLNQYKPLPNTFSRRQGYHGLCQVMITSLIIRGGSSWIPPTDVAVPWIVHTRRRDSQKYCQPTPEILNPEPWTLQSRLKYCLPVVLQQDRPRLSLFIWSKEYLSSFCGCVACSPLLTLN